MGKFWWQAKSWWGVSARIIIPEGQEGSYNCGKDKDHLAGPTYLKWTQAVLSLGQYDEHCFEGLRNKMNEITENEELLSAHRLLWWYKIRSKKGEGICIHAKVLCDLGDCDRSELLKDPDEREKMGINENFYQECSS